MERICLSPVRRFSRASSPSGPVPLTALSSERPYGKRHQRNGYSGNTHGLSLSALQSKVGTTMFVAYFQ